MSKQTKQQDSSKRDWDAEAREREKYQDVLEADERDQRKADRDEQRRNG